MIATVGVASGVFYSLSGNRVKRERAREQTCAQHLHQIYQALQEYSADWQGPEEVPGMGELKLVASPRALLKYVPDKDVFYCPNASSALRKRVWSSYQLDFLMVKPDGTTHVNQYLAWWKTQLRTMGPKAPLAICNTHDETYFAPMEEETDPDLAKPFQLRLGLDGSVEANRFNSRRYTTIVLN